MIKLNEYQLKYPTKFLDKLSLTDICCTAVTCKDQYFILTRRLALSSYVPVDTQLVAVV